MDPGPHPRAPLPDPDRPGEVAWLIWRWQDPAGAARAVPRRPCCCSPGWACAGGSARSATRSRRSPASAPLGALVLVLGGLLATARALAAADGPVGARCRSSTARRSSSSASSASTSPARSGRSARRPTWPAARRPGPGDGGGRPAVPRLPRRHRCAARRGTVIGGQSTVLAGLGFLCCGRRAGGLMPVVVAPLGRRIGGRSADQPGDTVRRGADGGRLDGVRRRPGAAVPGRSRGVTWSPRRRLRAGVRRRGGRRVRPGRGRRSRGGLRAPAGSAARRRHRDRPGPGGPGGAHLRRRSLAAGGGTPRRRAGRGRAGRPRARTPRPSLPGRRAG